MPYSVDVPYEEQPKVQIKNISLGNNSYIGTYYDIKSQAYLIFFKFKCFTVKRDIIKHTMVFDNDIINVTFQISNGQSLLKISFFDGGYAFYSVANSGKLILQTILDFKIGHIDFSSEQSFQIDTNHGLLRTNLVTEFGDRSSPSFDEWKTLNDKGLKKLKDEWFHWIYCSPSLDPDMHYIYGFYMDLCEGNFVLDLICIDSSLSKAKDIKRISLLDTFPDNLLFSRLEDMSIIIVCWNRTWIIQGSKFNIYFNEGLSNTKLIKFDKKDSKSIISLFAGNGKKYTAQRPKEGDSCIYWTETFTFITSPHYKRKHNKTNIIDIHFIRKGVMLAITQQGIILIKKRENNKQDIVTLWFAEKDNATEVISMNSDISLDRKLYNTSSTKGNFNYFYWKFDSIFTEIERPENSTFTADEFFDLWPTENGVQYDLITDDEPIIPNYDYKTVWGDQITGTSNTIFIKSVIAENGKREIFLFIESLSLANKFSFKVLEYFKDHTNSILCSKEVEIGIPQIQLIDIASFYDEHENACYFFLLYHDELKVIMGNGRVNTIRLKFESQVHPTKLYCQPLSVSEGLELGVIISCTGGNLLIHKVDLYDFNHIRSKFLSFNMSNFEGVRITSTNFFLFYNQTHTILINLINLTYGQIEINCKPFLIKSAFWPNNRIYIIDDKFEPHCYEVKDELKQGLASTKKNRTFKFKTGGKLNAIYRCPYSSKYIVVETISKKQKQIAISLFDPNTMSIITSLKVPGFTFVDMKFLKNEDSKALFSPINDIYSSTFILIVNDKNCSNAILYYVNDDKTIERHMQPRKLPFICNTVSFLDTYETLVFSGRSNNNAGNKVYSIQRLLHYDGYLQWNGNIENLICSDLDIFSEASNPILSFKLSNDSICFVDTFKNYIEYIYNKDYRDVTFIKKILVEDLGLIQNVPGLSVNDPRIFINEYGLLDIEPDTDRKDTLICINIKKVRRIEHLPMYTKIGETINEFKNGRESIYIAQASINSVLEVVDATTNKIKLHKKFQNLIVKICPLDGDWRPGMTVLPMFMIYLSDRSIKQINLVRTKAGEDEILI